jgi:hypothetical protein
MFRLIITSLLITILLTSCASPLKSETELVVNETFGTNFDYLDMIDVQRKIAGEEYELVTRLEPTEMVEFLKGLQPIEVPSNLENADYRFLLYTSEEGKEYNKKQTEAILYYSPDASALCNETKCIEVGNDLRKYYEERNIK